MPESKLSNFLEQGHLTDRNFPHVVLQAHNVYSADRLEPRDQGVS